MRRSLTKQERLRKKSDISRIFSYGRRFKTVGITLILIPNNLGHNRVLFTPLRKYGNSVQRNRIKRILREIIRNCKSEIKQGFDMVIMAFPGEWEYEDRRKQVYKVLTKADLFIQQ